MIRPPSSARRRTLVWAAPAFVALLALSPALGLPIAAAAVALRIGVALVRRHSRRKAFRQAGSGKRSVTLLGADSSGRPVLIPDRALAAHGLLLGATGAGKSTTLLTILSQQIARGAPVVAIDLKGSPAFARELEAAARAAGKPFVRWTPDGGAHWNPLAYGNATELKDKLIATEHFSEPHYKRAAERYLQLAIQVAQECEDRCPLTLERVVETLDPAQLAISARRLPRERGDYVRSYLNSLTPDQVSAVRGLQTRLAILTESHTGRFLQPAGSDSGQDRARSDREAAAGRRPDRERAPSAADRRADHHSPEVDLREALDGAQVVLFSLNSSVYGGLAAQLGTLAVQDLVSASGERLRDADGRSEKPRPALVGIDEFSALRSENVLSLLARGREAGVGVLLATQELADLDRAGRGLRDEVLGNTAVKIAHRQDVPASAETIARLAGQIKAWDVSYQDRAGPFGTALGTSTSARLVDRFAVEPEQVRTLRTGEALVIIKSPQSSARVTHVRPPRSHGAER